MDNLLKSYEALLGAEVIDGLHQVADALQGAKIVHVNSSKAGGGVAEILHAMLPLTQSLNIQADWEVIHGTEDFFLCTKMFHNLLQGQKGGEFDPSHLQSYEKTNAENAERLKPLLKDADFVFIHDPQPLALIDHFPDRKGKWIWRCHIDTSSPIKEVWDYLKGYAGKYDASIFSLQEFVQFLPHPYHIIQPSIDPLSEKNRELEGNEIQEVYESFGIDMHRPVMLQVSRYDHFKDPVGVIQAYHLAKKTHPRLQLVLAGGGAPDDPEGQIVLSEVYEAANNDPDIYILYLPPDAHHVINALQRGADIIVQKSIKEGFGLTVTEALWKEKPVIGGNTGGIRLQVINDLTGYLVNSPEEAASRIIYLLETPQKGKELGNKGKRLVKEKFLITRQLRDYLKLCT
ncbi:MAG TPA: glycosyltransferase [Rhabdochlamydiaceae bacterium]|nr:glycosyltransferase [Rhabdochlamydiaceae bacterium]